MISRLDPDFLPTPRSFLPRWSFSCSKWAWREPQHVDRGTTQDLTDLFFVWVLLAIRPRKRIKPCFPMAMVSASQPLVSKNQLAISGASHGRTGEICWNSWRSNLILPVGSCWILLVFLFVNHAPSPVTASDFSYFGPLVDDPFDPVDCSWGFRSSARMAVWIWAPVPHFAVRKCPGLPCWD